MSEFLEGEICGINSCISVIKHNPNSSLKDVEEKLRSMLDQLSVGLSEDVRKSYLIMEEKENE